MLARRCGAARQWRRGRDVSCFQPEWPKVDAACQFAVSTGRTSAIGALADIPDIVRGKKGTLISKQFAGLTWHG
jgi:hypothetical protein